MYKPTLMQFAEMFDFKLSPVQKKLVECIDSNDDVTICPKVKYHGKTSLNDVISKYDAYISDIKIRY